METPQFPLRSFADIEVNLVGAITPPYEIAVASARTCYSGKGIVYPQEVSKDEKAVVLRDKIASSTLEAGHLTTRQHAHFTFAIAGVSRHFLWNFLHSHPYYNSEQVSQRYVKVRSGNFLIPPLEDRAKSVYLEAVEFQRRAYEDLIGALKEPLSGDFYTRFPGRKRKPELWEKAIDKRAFEVARYVLGLGTTAYLYHTVSSLTLMRYARLQNLFETPTEQKIVVQKMLDCVRAIDPLFEKEIPDPVPLESTLEYKLFQEFQSTDFHASEAFVEEFDRSLEGKISKLVGYTPHAEKMLATSLRLMLGKTEKEISDERALALLLDPKENASMGDTLNVLTTERIGQVLHHVHFTFRKKISHAADSQDQRHRTVLSSRPYLAFHYTGKPDYIVPFGVTQSDRALEIYEGSMKRSFEAVGKLLELGASTEHAFYLLPNAVPIRMISTGDLQALQHKWKLRACYNAQEEIFRATIDELKQVREVVPAVVEHMRAPCYGRLRAGVKPYCPEGDRFCGLPVWKYDLPQYQRKSL